MEKGQRVIKTIIGINLVNIQLCVIMTNIILNRPFYEMGHFVETEILDRIKKKSSQMPQMQCK